MKSHHELQKKIIQRERALGMKPVLPAFTGHVPEAFKKHFPKAKLKATNWTNGFADTYILDAEDPLFAELGKSSCKSKRKCLVQTIFTLLILSTKTNRLRMNLHFYQN
jgi:alpha-N-acetylglucosaminidase